VQNVFVTPGSYNLITGNERRFIATVYPLNATNQGYRWESSNPRVASVDSSGLVRAHNPGTVRIYAVADCGDRRGVSVVTVRNPQPPPPPPSDETGHWIFPLAPKYPPELTDPNLVIPVELCVIIPSEQQANIVMQRMIFEIRDTYFPESMWRDATISQRHAMLEQFFNRIRPVLNIEEPAFEFFNRPPRECGRITGGYFRPRWLWETRHRIRINEYIVLNRAYHQSYIVFEIIMHEARHMFQHEAANSQKHRVSPQSREVWRANFGQYIRPETDMYAYILQPLEFDAFMFTNDIFRIRSAERNSGNPPRYTGGWIWPPR